MVSQKGFMKPSGKKLKLLFPIKYENLFQQKNEALLKDKQL